VLLKPYQTHTSLCDGLTTNNLNLKTVSRTDLDNERAEWMELK